MAEKVYLINATKKPRRMLVLSLHGIDAKETITRTTQERTRQGEVARRVTRVRIATSLRIPAGGRREVAPEALNAPEVKKAIAARHVKVQRVEIKEPAPAPKKKASDKGGNDGSKTRKRKS